MGGCQSGHSLLLLSRNSVGCRVGGGGKNMTDLGWQGHKDVINALVLYRQMNDKKKEHGETCLQTVRI